MIVVPDGGRLLGIEYRVEIAKCFVTSKPIGQFVGREEVIGTGLRFGRVML